MSSSHPPDRQGAREQDRPRSVVIVRFTCTRRHDLVGIAPGLLVAHHGTFGYCSGGVGGRHEWIEVRTGALELLHATASAGTSSRSEGDVRP